MSRCSSTVLTVQGMVGLSSWQHVLLAARRDDVGRGRRRALGVEGGDGRP